jgi:hypothetical protein
MGPGHLRKHAAPAGRTRPVRLLVVVLAPLLVLVPLTAFATSHSSHTSHLAHVVHAARQEAAPPAAATRRLLWSRSWSPALALLSNYRTCCPSKAGFRALPTTFDFLGFQRVSATATFRTRWVDAKALVDGPNIAQQGLFAQAAQLKLQIGHSPVSSQHVGECRVKGTTGAVLAKGPPIDIADGHWHTVTCIKSPDTPTRTKVVVIVDGVAGKATWSSTPIGDVQPVGTVDLGGRSAVASTDSLDGWLRSISFWLG